MVCAAMFKENVSAVGKVVAVTGCNTGIGLETAKELNLRGAKVYMLCRSEEKAMAAKTEMVKGGCESSRLIFLPLDLGSFKSVRSCATRLSELEPRLDILVNNAGLWPDHFTTTVEGHETAWQCNHLSPALLTELLLPNIEKSSEGRIVIVSSDLANYSSKLDLATINSEKNYPGGQAQYSRSKLANVMYTRSLARRLKERGSAVTVNSLHPGVIRTELLRDQGGAMKIFRSIGGVFMKSPVEGAQTSLYLALSTEVKGQSGGYYAECKKAKDVTNAKDDYACRELYEYTLKTVELSYISQH